MRKARIENGRVAEILNADPFPPFHLSLKWVACDGTVVEGDLYTEGGGFASPPPPTAPVTVTMRQARLALLQSGLLATVNAAVASMPGADGEAARIEWEFSGTVERNRPLVQTLSEALNLTEAQLDDLFALAATL